MKRFGTVSKEIRKENCNSPVQKALRVQQSDTKIDFGIDAYCDDNKRRHVSQVTGAKVT